MTEPSISKLFDGVHEKCLELTPLRRLVCEDPFPATCAAQTCARGQEAGVRIRMCHNSCTRPVCKSTKTK